MNISWWPSEIDVNAVWWRDYHSIVTSLPGDNFPDCKSLNRLLPEHVRNANDQAINFVASTELQQGGYEDRIFSSGHVSTRPHSWHDLFNAMVWLRFPRIKLAMNALHHGAEPESRGRGQLRDALTLFDECGVLLISARKDILETIGSRAWPQVFQTPHCSWNKDLLAAICGHAMLEKLLAPYKAITAKALLVQVSSQAMLLPRNQLLNLLDHGIAKQLMQGNILFKPAHLTPLPLAGIPGWDFAGEQNQHFYSDLDVFRPAPTGLKPAPILQL